MDEFKKYFQDHRADLDTDLPGEELWEGVKKTLHPKPAVPLYLKWVAAACVVIVATTTVFFFVNKRTDVLAEQSGTKKAPVIQQSVESKNDQLVTAPGKNEQVITDTAAQQKVAQKIITQPSPKRQERQEIRPLPATNTLVKTRTGSGRNKEKPRYGFEEVEASYASMLDVQLEQIRSQPIYGENAAYFDLFKNQFEDLNKEEVKLKKEFKSADDKVILLDALILVYQRKITILKQLQFEINKMNSKVKQTDTGVPMQQPSYIHL